MDEEYYFDDWDTGSDYYAPSDYEPVWNEDLSTGMGSIDNYEAPYFDGSGFQLSDFQLPENYSDQFPWAADTASLGQGTWGDFAPGALSTEGLPMEAYLADRDPGLMFANQVAPGAVPMVSPEEQGLMSPDVQNRAMNEGAQYIGGGFMSVDGQPVSVQDYVSGARGIDPRITNYGLDPARVHDLSGGLATRYDDEGLGTGILDKYGMLGGNDWNNAGVGVLMQGAPSQALSTNDIRVLGDDRTLDDWAKNENLSWQDYARDNNYDPHDIGTDLRWSLGNALPSAGYGGIGGKGVGSQLTPKALESIVKSGGTSAGKGSSSGGSSAAKPVSPAQVKRLLDGTASAKDKAQAAAGGLSMAALMALELMKQGRTGPKSSQGTIGANQWNIARMNNRGVAPAKAQGGLIQMAEGGSVKEKLMKMFGPLFAPATTEQRRPREDYRDEVRGLIYEDRGMLPDAARNLTGRRHQLDELERHAVEGRARGGSIRGGQSDVVPIMAAPGEYMMDADVVSALGDGSTEAGAAKLDQMREAIRSHKRGASRGNIPPMARSPLAYMKGRVK